jgi:hypothetical protein
LVATFDLTTPGRISAGGFLVDRQEFNDRDPGWTHTKNQRARDAGSGRFYYPNENAIEAYPASMA